MYGFMTTGLLELAFLQRKITKPKRPRTSTRRFKQRLFWRDGGRCQYCFRPVPFNKATQEHVTPLVHQGDPRSKENVVIACKGCNAKKGPLLMDELGDLAPEALKEKFEKVYNAESKPKGVNPYFQPVGVVQSEEHPPRKAETGVRIPTSASTIRSEFTHEMDVQLTHPPLSEEFIQRLNRLNQRLDERIKLGNQVLKGQ